MFCDISDKETIIKIEGDIVEDNTEEKNKEKLAENKLIILYLLNMSCTQAKHNI